MGGLHRDLAATSAVMDRRGMLRLAARFGVGAGMLQMLGCGSSPTSPTTTANTTQTSGGTASSACSAIPQETAGPYPGDGSNGPNVLSLTGVVRSDIRSSFAGLNGVADGVPLNIVLTIVSRSTCAPLAGQAVYLWHCDRPGRYSLYTAGVTNQNFLRGVQAADSNGQVTFASIFPGCYAGRWPHIHFEVYPSLSAATNVANKTATSQIALPKAACDLVRDRRLREQRHKSLAGHAGERQRVQRRLGARAGDDERLGRGGFTAALTVAVEPGDTIS